eukprot:INCI4190.1.p1 GENE.INCI4190.1~~INCI4190.1.p1  ORF type:complete len:559 (+),score=123.92 INCI4190.1:255-1931(+)
MAEQAAKSTALSGANAPVTQNTAEADLREILVTMEQFTACPAREQLVEWNAKTKATACSGSASQKQKMKLLKKCIRACGTYLMSLQDADKTSLDIAHKLPSTSVNEFLNEIHKLDKISPALNGQASSANSSAASDEELRRLRLRLLFHQHRHLPRTRSWSAEEIRGVTEFLRAIGFRVDDPVELNQMLPDGAKMSTRGGAATKKARSGNKLEAQVPQSVREANVFVWRQAAHQLGLKVNRLYAQLEGLPVDKFKWSRRAKPGTGGLQNKLARHNCCFTDLEEEVRDPDEGDIVEGMRVRHKHPKNPNIKFTNYSFDAASELLKFRQRLPRVLGPYGYKVAHQFAELNKYYDETRGIGRHGDVERDHGEAAGAVNCLKVGFHVPLLFSWYRDCKPAGKGVALGDAGRKAAGAYVVDKAIFPVVPFKAKKTSTVAAVVSLGHGDMYMMSDKAIGKDWKRHDWALRHCAGARQYTQLPKAYYDALRSRFSTSTGRFASAYSLTFSDVVENDSESPELQFSTRFAGLADLCDTGAAAPSSDGAVGEAGAGGAAAPARKRKAK